MPLHCCKHVTKGEARTQMLRMHLTDVCICSFNFKHTSNGVEQFISPLTTNDFISCSVSELLSFGSKLGVYSDFFLIRPRQ